MTRGLCVVIAVTSLAVAAARPSAAADRMLRAEVVLDAPPSEVWRAWTTVDGVRSFFAPDCRIDLRVDGLYDIRFNPTAPAGARGADEMRILVVEPGTRFAFTWNAPPDHPEVRAQRTVVFVEIAPAGAARTRLRLTHLGWGAGPAWDRAFDYFDRAWRETVLPRLVYRFAHGPVDWARPPVLDAVADTMKVPW